MAQRFQNLPGGVEPEINPWIWAQFLYRRLRMHPPQIIVPPTHILPYNEVLQQRQQLIHQDHLTWIGHDTFLLRLGNKTIITDPFFSERASPLQSFGPKRFVASPLKITELPPIDIIVVSHSHYDHFDLLSVAAFPNKENIQVVVPLGLGKYFQRVGYKQVTELNWYETWEQEQFNITALPAKHFSRRGLFDFNRSLWASFSICSANQRIFFAGDTGYADFFEKMGADYGPFDYALLPIGAYEPRNLMCGSHVNPEEAVSVARNLGARTLVGMHWGTIMLTDEPAFEPPQRFTIAAAAAGFTPENIWVMRIGETRELS